jgi:hypothetical protein
MLVLLGLTPDFESALRILESYGKPISNEVKLAYKFPGHNPAPGNGG